MFISRSVPDERNPHIIRYEVSRSGEAPHGRATVCVLPNFVRRSTERMRATLLQHDPDITDDSVIMGINSFFPNGRDTALLRKGTATRVLAAICEDALSVGARGIFVSLVMDEAMSLFLEARGFTGFKLGEVGGHTFYYRPLEA